MKKVFSKDIYLLFVCLCVVDYIGTQVNKLNLLFALASLRVEGRTFLFFSDFYYLYLNFFSILCQAYLFIFLNLN